MKNEMFWYVISSFISIVLLGRHCIAINIAPSWPQIFNLLLLSSVAFFYIFLSLDMITKAFFFFFKSTFPSFSILFLPLFSYLLPHFLLTFHSFSSSIFHPALISTRLPPLKNIEIPPALTAGPICSAVFIVQAHCFFFYHGTEAGEQGLSATPAVLFLALQRCDD